MKTLQQRLNDMTAGQVRAMTPQVTVDNEVAAKLVESNNVAMAEMLIALQQTLIQQAEFSRQQAQAINALMGRLDQWEAKETKVSVEAPHVTVERGRAPYSIEIMPSDDGGYMARVMPDDEG